VAATRGRAGARFRGSRELFGRSGYRVARLRVVVKDHHGEHGRSCYEQRYAPNPGTNKTPARADLFGGELGEDMSGAITHIGIFVLSAPPDADGRLLAAISGVAELS
jgi:hypothetical protein